MKVKKINLYSKMHLSLLLISAIITTSLINCVDRSLGPVDPQTYTYLTETINQADTTSIDILVVVDNSNSMRGEQIALAKNFPLIIDALFNGSDSESPDSEAPEIKDLHLGIVSVNLGVGGNKIQNCDGNGDDGIMFNTFKCVGDDCPEDCNDVALSSQFMQYPDDSTDVVSHQFSCIAQLGTGGCGFEQQLEVALRALTIQSGSGMPNEGFLRENALLAIIFVTDEDDCSAEDTHLFDQSRTDLGNNLQTRCFLKQNEGLLYPLERYYEGFRALKDDPDKFLVVAGIVGLPENWDNTVESLEKIKYSPSVNDPYNPGSQRVKWACESKIEPESPYRYADAAARIVNLIQMFGDNGSVYSICEDNWAKIMESITAKIQGKIKSSNCLPRKISNENDCIVVETIPGNINCDQLDGDYEYFMDESINYIDENSNEFTKCNIVAKNQNPQQEGWYYVSPEENIENDGCAEIRFTENAIPVSGSETYLECSTSLCPRRRECQDAGPGGSDCCDDGYYCSNGQCIVDPR